MKRRILASFCIALLFALSGIGIVCAAESGVYQYVQSESMDQMVDHLRNVCLSVPSLAANGSASGNMDIGGAAGQTLLLRIQNRLVSYPVATAKTIDVDASSGVSWYSASGAPSTFDGIKTVAAGKCSGWLVQADDTPTTPAWVLVRAPDVAASSGAKAKIPDIPKALLKTHVPIGFIKFNNVTGSAVVLGTLALSDNKVALFNLGSAFPGEEL